MLQTETIADPERFARLALRLTDRANPAYGDAILIALADPGRPIAPAAVFDVIRHIASLGHEDYQDWLGWPLRRYLDGDVPDDIIEIILGRALHATSPTGDGWLPGEDREPYGRDIFNSGLNSARGQSAVVLGDLIMHDASGHRTALVAPSLSQLAADPVVAVRACVAHILTACLRYARTDAIAAFRQLIDTDDRLLSAGQVLDLMMYIAFGEPQEIEPVIQRMLGSTHAQVRRAGGQLAAFAGLELGLGQLLIAVRDSQDAATRNGAAFVCARRLPHTKDARAAADALQQFVDDPDDGVRKTAAEVAGALRGQALQPFATVLTKLIASPAFSDALPQLLITLQQAPDRIDGLVTQCARRFVNVHGADASNIQTAAAGEAPEIGRLVLRAYAQAADSAARGPVLDLIDDLLFSGAYEFDRIIDEAER